MAKADPIRAKYYAPLERAEKWNTLLFYGAAALSLLVLFIPKDVVFWHAAANIGFLISSIGVFALNTSISLYFASRAEAERRKDLLGDGLGVPLTYERTTEYYNNEETEPFRRLGVDVLENTFHSRDTARIMCGQERVKVAIYTMGWLTAVLIRTASFDLIAVLSQVIFSEQLLLRWIKLEWLRSQCERIHDALLIVLRGQTQIPLLTSQVIEQLLAYETAKGRAGIVLSKEIFDRRNDAVSRDWQKEKATLAAATTGAGDEA